MRYLRYRLDQAKNPNILTLHTNRLILQGVETYERGDKPKGKYAEFLNRLLRIRGIVRILPETYEVDIEKGTAFSWDEIRPQVLRALRQAAGRSRLVELPPEEPEEDDLPF